MTLRLHVDGDRWHAHLRGFGEREPEVIPVVKGNGYGFGFERLLAEPGPNHWGDIAVGTYAEAVSALGSTSRPASSCSTRGGRRTRPRRLRSPPTG